MPECFTLLEFQALPDMSSAESADVDAAEAYFVDIVEEEIGTPLVPRSNTVTLSGGRLAALALPHSKVRSLTSVTVDGVAVNTADLTYVNGLLRYAAGTTWAATQLNNVVVTYQHGEWADCPDGFKVPLMWAVRDQLLAQDQNAGIDVRRTSVQTEYGTTSYVLPGEKRPTGFPALDAAIATYQRRRPGGFA